MKKSFISIIFGLLSLSVTNAQKYSHNPAMLRVDSICLRGNMMDMMMQRVDMHVYNTGDSIFNGYFILVKKADTDYPQNYPYSGFLTLPPGQSSMVHIPIQLPQGDYTFGIFGDSDKKKENQLGEDIHISVGPLRKLHFKADFKLDMMSEGLLFGRRIQGKLSVINVDSVPYYGALGFEKYGTEVRCYLKSEGKIIEAFEFIPGDKTFEPGDTISTMLGLNYDFEEGKSYALTVDYIAPGHNEPIDSLEFTFVAGISTFWTAEGTMELMKMLDTHYDPVAPFSLKVPENAVAIDLRGLPSNVKYNIDVSRANPNCLYYLDSLGNEPQGITNTCNIVRSGHAPVIRLTDNYNFFCPRPFWTEYVSYTLQPNNTRPGQGLYAETLVLPFNPKSVFFNDINSNDNNLHRELLKILHFKHIWFDKLVIEEVDIKEMHAYNAYIMVVFVKTPVTFCAENAYMYATTLPDGGQKGKFNLRGSTVFCSPTTKTYRYQPEIMAFVKQETDELLPPFRAWICEGEKVLAAGEQPQSSEGEIIDGESLGDILYIDEEHISESQGIMDVAIPSKTPIKTYSLSGVPRKPGVLVNGLNIVGGKKIVVSK